MAQASHGVMSSTMRPALQTVFGFGSPLDRIPTAFVDASPSTRICCACGLVPSTLLILPCHHPLCQPCHDEHEKKYGHCCPVDKQPYREDDVGWMSFSRDQLMSRRVLCWSTPNGCDFEGEVADMVEHFQNDCRFYCTTCLNCGIVFLQPHMAEHRRSCCQPLLQRSRQGPPRLLCAVTAQLEEPLKLIAEQIAAMRESVEFLQDHLYGDGSTSVVDRLTLIESALQRAGLTPDYEGQGEDTYSSDCFVHAHAGDTEQRDEVQTRAILAQHRDALSTQIRNALADSQRTAVAVFKRECEVAVETFAQQRTNAEDAQAASSSRGRLICDLSHKIGAFQEKLCKKETVSGTDLARSMQLLAVTSLAATNDVTNISSPLEWTMSVNESTWSEHTFTMAGPCNYFYGYLVGFLLNFDLHNAEFTPCVLEGLYDDLLTLPPGLGLSIDLIHPADPTKNITLSRQTKWKKAGKCWVFPRVLQEGSCQSIRSSTLRDGGFIANGKLSLRFNLTRLERWFFSGAP